jgi:hypothetical protein
MKIGETVVHINRYDNKIKFERVEDGLLMSMDMSNPFARTGYQTTIDNDPYISFVDPSGGPFIQVGDLLYGVNITNIEPDGNGRYLLKGDTKR